MVKEALDALKPTEVHLYMPYLPYARQDRRCEHGEAFSLKVFCNIINFMNFNSVKILDCHSDVGAALLNNVINTSNNSLIAGFCLDTEDLVLISPDAGSNKKINKLAQKYQFDSIVKCDKTRDTKTGQLTGFEVFTDDLLHKNCIIIDDICDGGGTFIGLAQELKKKNAGNLYLMVTHGIFSKGFDELNKYFSKIYCTNSIKDITNGNGEQPEHKGAIELLWDIFGGTINEQGYKVLDSHIGAIYGDSITLERQVEIYKSLETKGFASTNITLGVGSFTYQYNTRDTFGFAAKGAWFEANGVGYDIYKDPVTDDGMKKSLKGLCTVCQNDVTGDYYVLDQSTKEQEEQRELKVIYENGNFYNQTSITDIREIIINQHK